MKLVNTGKIFDAGVDWFTGTISDPNDCRSAANDAMRILRSEERLGNKLKPWSMFAYHGWACGGIATGESPDSLMVRLSSECARENWRRFAEVASNVSRLDLQVTVRYAHNAMTEIARVYRKLKRSRGSDGRKRTISLYQSSDGSATIYIGQRVSENYGRIYAKGKETPLPYWANSVRFEAEFKGDVAWREQKQLYRAPSEYDHIVSRCQAFMAERGTSQISATPGRDSVTTQPSSMMTADATRAQRSLSDADRTLQWLANGVRCSVATLRESGRLYDALTALGLSDLVHPLDIDSDVAPPEESEV